MGCKKAVAILHIQELNPWVKGTAPEHSLIPTTLLSRTFNPADYAEPSGTEEGYGNSTNNTWNNTGSFEPDDGTSM